MNVFVCVWKGGGGRGACVCNRARERREKNKPLKEEESPQQKVLPRHHLHTSIGNEVLRQTQDPQYYD